MNHGVGASACARRRPLAVINNLHWYQAMFDAHGSSHQVDGGMWRSLALPPAFHSNLVVLSPQVSADNIEAQARVIEAGAPRVGFTLKDSFANLDLANHGFELLFEAQWIWRDAARASEPGATGRLDWAPITTAAELRAWEAAWRGDAAEDPANPGQRQFPAALLRSPDHLFLAGRRGDTIVAGAIANRSPGAVGVSNLFAPPAEAEAAWHAIVRRISRQFRDLPLVGYERGADLALACAAGFGPIGGLRVWRRLSRCSSP
jgi:hypothetical protein